MTNTQHNATDPGEILVLGGTGKVGRRTLETLHAQGHRAVGASRSGSRRFDWAAPDTWDPALHGVDRVFLIASDEHPEAVAPFVQRAVAAGVGRLVALAGRRIDRLSAFDGTAMSAADAAVRASGVEWTVLQPNNFHQNFDEGVFAEEVKAGYITVPMGDHPEPFVDTADIAAVAAEVLTTDGHSGRGYELTGGEAISFGTAAEIISRATGRRIEYRDVSPEHYRGLLAELGVDGEAIAFLDGMYAVMRTGAIADPSPDVKRVLGRDPISFTEFARNAAAGGAWDV